MMSQELVIGIYGVSVATLAIFYLFYMIKLQKTDGEYDILSLFFFWKPIETNSAQSSYTIKQKRNAGVSEIERLEQKLLETDDVDERQSLLDQIRRLQNG